MTREQQKQMYASKYIGQTKEMKCGKTATITMYMGGGRIGVQFPDGVYKETSIASFKAGTVTHPHVPRTLPDTRAKFGSKAIGQKQMMECGLEGEVIAYNDALDVTVRFSDGVVVTHQRISKFRHGKIAYPDNRKQVFEKLYSKKYVGEKRMQVCGYSCEVIAYRNSSDADVRFEDGVELKHISIQRFLNGWIVHPTRGRKPTENMAWDYRMLYESMSEVFPDLGFKVKVKDLVMKRGQPLTTTIFSESGRIAVDIIHCRMHVNPDKYDILLNSGYVDTVYVIAQQTHMPSIVRDGLHKYYMNYTNSRESMEDIIKYILEDCKQYERVN